MRIPHKYGDNQSINTKFIFFVKCLWDMSHLMLVHGPSLPNHPTYCFTVNTRHYHTVVSSGYILVVFTRHSTTTNVAEMKNCLHMLLRWTRSNDRYKTNLYIKMRSDSASSKIISQINSSNNFSLQTFSIKLFKMLLYLVFWTSYPN